MQKILFLRVSGLKPGSATTLFPEQESNLPSVSLHVLHVTLPWTNNHGGCGNNNNSSSNNNNNNNHNHHNHNHNHNHNSHIVLKEEEKNQQASRPYSGGEGLVENEESDCHSSCNRSVG